MKDFITTLILLGFIIAAISIAVTSLASLGLPLWAAAIVFGLLK